MVEDAGDNHVPDLGEEIPGWWLRGGGVPGRRRFSINPESGGGGGPPEEDPMHQDEGYGTQHIDVRPGAQGGKIQDSPCDMNVIQILALMISLCFVYYHSMDQFVICTSIFSHFSKVSPIY